MLLFHSYIIILATNNYDVSLDPFKFNKRYENIYYLFNNFLKITNRNDLPFMKCVLKIFKFKKKIYICKEICSKSKNSKYAFINEIKL